MIIKKSKSTVCRVNFAARVLPLAVLAFLIAGCAQMPNPKRPVLVPVVTDHFVNIYKPQEDVYTRPTRKTTRGKSTIIYEQGKSYKNWRTNDHTFIKDHNNRWHCFGITKPWMSGDNSHAGEGLCFHALAPKTANGTFAETVEFQSWRDRPKIPEEGGVGWAPSAIKIGSQYNLIGSGLDRMVSDDLENWTYAGKLNINLEGVGGKTRDPHISVIDGIYHMVICCGNKVGLSTSKDFVNWTDMVVIFKPENDEWDTESPFLLPYDGRYYLFWSMWDKGDLTTYGYPTRTFVQCSDSLMDFNGEPLIELAVKAPRLIQDTDGAWFISSTDHPHRGISVAPLEWKTGGGNINKDI